MWVTAFIKYNRREARLQIKDVVVRYVRGVRSFPVNS